MRNKEIRMLNIQIAKISKSHCAIQNCILDNHRTNNCIHNDENACQIHQNQNVVYEILNMDLKEDQINYKNCTMIESSLSLSYYDIQMADDDIHDGLGRILHLDSLQTRLKDKLANSVHTVKQYQRNKLPFYVKVYVTYRSCRTLG